MSKKLLHLFRQATITALFGAVVVAFIVPISAQAQATGPAPRGQVLQAADSCPIKAQKTSGTSGFIYTYYQYDGLTVSVDKAQAAPGETLSITYAIKPECQSKLVSAPGYKVQLHHSAFSVEDSTAQNFSSLQNQPASGSLPMQVTTNAFAPGAHSVAVVLVGTSAVSGLGNTTAQTHFFVGSFNFTVSGSPQTGDAQLRAQFVSSGLDATKPFYEYSFSYVAGSSGKDANSVSVNCGGGELSGGNPIPYGSSQNARCIFPPPPTGSQPVKYTITFQALDASGQLIDKAITTAEVAVTGAESNSQTVAESYGNPVVTFINFVIGSVLKFFIATMGAAIGIIGTLLESVLSIRTFSDEFANVIYPAWEIFRNLGNIFFILAIVAIGVATVFRISNYQVKDLLVKLILGAILINFSLTIAQAVLGISDTLQQQFLSNRSGAVRAIVNTLFVSNIWADTPGTQLGDFSETIRIVTQFFIAFAAFFAILAIAILVCVRVVMLWLLLMLSPIPYVAMILPSTRKFSSQWWDAFINWALVTPAVGFMLNLTALMTTKNSTVIQDLAAKGQLAANESWLNNATFALARNVIPLIFLYMTLRVAMHFGKGAGGFVTKSLNKVSGMAFAPAAALGGYAAGAASGIATSTGNFAKNVGKAPLVLAQQKLAEGKASREVRLQAKDGSATASDYLFNALSMPSKMNQVLEAKVKRGEGNVKDAQKKYGELVTDLERRKYSWDGTKAIGNRVRLRSKEFWSDRKELTEQSQIQTEAELKELVKTGVTDSTATAEANEKAFEDAFKDDRITYAEVKDQLQNVTQTLEQGPASPEHKKELEARQEALQKVLDNRDLMQKYATKLTSDGSEDLAKVEVAKVAALKQAADQKLEEFKNLELKSEYAPSYLADKYRRANTKGAASKLPDEYVYGEVIDFARKAFAKGDTYGALAAVEQMQKEGNTKDFLKEFGHPDTAEGLKGFFRQKFGGMGEDTVIRLMRESDKYAKSAGAWDLAGKIKYDEKSRQYVEAKEEARIAKSLADKIGEGTVDALWRQLTGKVSFTTDTDGKTRLSDTYIAAIKQLPFDDPRALQKFMNSHNGPTAKAITVKGDKFKTDEELQVVRDQLEKELGPEHFNQVYKLLQYNSGVMPVVAKPETGEVDKDQTKAAEEEILQVVRKVNSDVKELNKAANPKKDTKDGVNPKPGSAGGGNKPSAQSKKPKNNGGNPPPKSRIGFV
ncbi:MAG: hypothetical protein KBD66_01330 [Candidatus Doudnabacteria bacterium]|nr:hypothetical protein [Candidatus Doudnabacteria bacterium]